MKEILLTVIVTIYNLAPYISRCINSIRSQTYQNIEIILVNDGSEDNSGEICDEVATSDERIKVIHKSNGGLLSARKAGIENATGEVVTFVDGDDWIESDMYQRLIDIYVEQESDMVSSGLTYDYGQNKKVQFELDLIQEGTYEREEIERIIPIMMHKPEEGRRAITPSVCNKIFKISLLRNIIKNIDEQITFGEDAAISYTFIINSNKISIVNKSWYHYMIRNNSMCSKFDINVFEKAYLLQKYFVNEYKKNGMRESMERQVISYIKPILRSGIHAIYDIKMEEIEYLFPYESIPAGSKIILYGAGVIGQSYWKCLESGEYASVVLWVDRKYEDLQEKFEVNSPEDIKKHVDVDFVIIAAQNEKSLEEIVSYVESCGIKKEKIIWKKPKHI